MKKTILFCASYGEIKITLYLIEENPDIRSVMIIIPGMQDLYKFFQYLNEKIYDNLLTIIFLDIYQPKWHREKGIKRLFLLFPDIISERKYLDHLFTTGFTDIEGAKIYFHNRGFSGYEMYFLKRLSKKNTIIATTPNPPQIQGISYYFPRNLIHLFSLILLKLIFGSDIALGQLSYSKGFIFMTDTFMQKYVSTIISWEDMARMTDGFDLDKFKIGLTGDYRVLYIDQDLLESGYVKNKERLRKELRTIFSILTRYFPKDTIARKYHPSHPGDKNLISTGDILPDYIPAEFLINEKIQIYISILSNAITNIATGMVISIADLITFANERDKIQIKNNITGMKKTEILFPQTIEEFERVIAASAGRDNES